MNTTLRLPLLGQRKYLQGTTLLDALLEHCCPETRCVYKVPHMILSNAVELRDCGQPDATVSAVSGENATISATASASLSWYTETGDPREMLVYALPMADPVVREPFDEERITGNARWSAGSVQAPIPDGETLIRCAVSLNKALVKREVPQTAPGQWLFTRLELPRMYQPAKELTVTLLRKFGTAATVSSVTTEHGPMGTLYFSWLNA